MYTLETVMNFGKYKGLTLRHIIHKDSSYIEWVLENDIIEMDSEALEYITNVYQHYDYSDHDNVSPLNKF